MVVSVAGGQGLLARTHPDGNGEPLKAWEWGCVVRPKRGGPSWQLCHGWTGAWSPERKLCCPWVKQWPGSSWDKRVQGGQKLWVGCGG